MTNETTINKYFKPGMPAEQVEDTIIKALDFYKKHSRDRER